MIKLLYKPDLIDDMVAGVLAGLICGTVSP
jgi:hypothetical protein